MNARRCPHELRQTVRLVVESLSAFSLMLSRPSPMAVCIESPGVGWIETRCRWLSSTILFSLDRVDRFLASK